MRIVDIESDSTDCYEHDISVLKTTFAIVNRSVLMTALQGLHCIEGTFTVQVRYAYALTVENGPLVGEAYM